MSDKGTKDAGKEVKKPRKKRTQRPFPAAVFEEPLAFAQKVFSIGSGQPVKRLTLFDELGKSPESGASRQLIINSGRYGLTKGGIQAESIELTDDGRKCVDDQITAREMARSRIHLAIRSVEIFGNLYDRFVGNKLPAHSVLTDALKDEGVEDEYLSEAVDTFIVNLRFVGLLKTLSGAERIVPVDMHLDELPASGPIKRTAVLHNLDGELRNPNNQLMTSDQAQFESTCFYIAPIGDEGSEARKHSDLFLGSFVEPAVEEFGLTVVRADAIDKPGIITRQIIDYVMKSRIVVADLSYHNPNVFYELALRHAVKLPIIQIARAADKIPFDINQMRTIIIDTTDIYTLLPKIESYRSEISAQIRRALDKDYVVDTPVSIYYPNLQIQF
tara:strand:+ start:1423 stop:2583 length:1161 start_codon:yes stop_codon:yes gene_type:complete